MTTNYRDHTVDFKLRVISEYQPGVRGHGFAAVAERFGVEHKSVVRKWVSQYNGTKESLTKQTRPNNKRKMTLEESEEHINKFVAKKNKAGEAVDYGMVKKEVKEQLDKDVSLRTLQRYGHEDHGLTYKRTTRQLIAEGEF